MKRLVNKAVCSVVQCLRKWPLKGELSGALCRDCVHMSHCGQPTNHCACQFLWSTVPDMSLMQRFLVFLRNCLNTAEGTSAALRPCLLAYCGDGSKVVYTTSYVYFHTPRVGPASRQFAFAARRGHSVYLSLSCYSGALCLVLHYCVRSMPNQVTTDAEKKLRWTAFLRFRWQIQLGWRTSQF